MTKIVKDLPADPLEYLVGKIQALQRQKKRVILVSIVHCTLIDSCYLPSSV